MIQVIILDCLFLVSYYLTKKIMHPAVIVSGVWMFILNLYYFTDNNLYPLSAKICWVVVLWVFLFVGSSIIFSKRSIKIGENFKRSKPQIHIIKKLYPIVCTLNILFSILVLKEVGGALSLDAFVTAREGLLEDKFPLYLKLLFYFNSFSTVYLMIVSLYGGILTKKQYIYLVIILLIATFVRTNKTAVISLASALFYIYYVRGLLTKTRIIIGILGVVAILYISILLRGDVTESFDVTKYLIIYTLSPLTAMDMIMNGDYTVFSGAWGSSTFMVFYKIINFFGFNYDIASRGEWVSVPFPTNVFTVLRGFYVDFGLTGIIVFSILLGSIWGIIFKWSVRGYGIFIIFYALMMYALVLQFFADYVFITFSTTLQYLFFTILLYLPIKYRYIRQYK